MGEQLLDNGPTSRALGSSRRKSGPDDRVEALPTKPFCDSRPHALVHVARSDSRIRRRMKADPGWPPVSGNFLANPESLDG